MRRTPRYRSMAKGEIELGFRYWHTKESASSIILAKGSQPYTLSVLLGNCKIGFLSYLIIAQLQKVRHEKSVGDEHQPAVSKAWKETWR